MPNHLAHRLIAVAIGLVLALALAGCAQGIPPNDAPPAGSMWFGASYDPQTFALTAKADTFTVGEPVALVATLPPGQPGEPVIVYLDGPGTSGTYPVAGGTLLDGATVFAVVIETVEVPGASPLATGRFTMTALP